MQDTLSDKSSLSPCYFGNLDQKILSIFLEKIETTLSKQNIIFKKIYRVQAFH